MTTEAMSTEDALQRAEESLCTCGAGAGSLEGHVASWCGWTAFLKWAAANLDTAAALAAGTMGAVKPSGLEALRLLAAVSPPTSDKGQ